MCEVYIIFSCLMAAVAVRANQQYHDVVLVNLYHNNLDFFDSFLSPDKIDGLQHSSENISFETIRTLNRTSKSYLSMRNGLMSWCAEVNKNADLSANNFDLLLNRDEFVTNMNRGINDMKTNFDSMTTNNDTPPGQRRSLECGNEAGNPSEPSVGHIDKPTSARISSTTMQPLNTAIIRGPVTQFVSLGTTMRYTCEATSDHTLPVTTQWFKEDGILPPTRSIDNGNGTLIINNASLDDSGIYKCNVYDTRQSHHLFTQKIRVIVKDPNTYLESTPDVPKNSSQMKTGHRKNIEKNPNIPPAERKKRQAYDTKNPTKTFEDEMEYAKSLIDKALKDIRVIYYVEKKGIDVKETVKSCKPVLDKLATSHANLRQYTTTKPPRYTPTKPSQYMPDEPRQYTLPSQTVSPPSKDTLGVHYKSCSNWRYNSNDKDLCEAILSKSTMEHFVKMYHLKNTVSDIFKAINSVGSTQECKNQMQSFITDYYISWAYDVPKMRSMQYMKISICLNSDRSAQVTIVN